MQTFKVNEKITIDCESKSNRRGFQHIATLKIDDLKALTTRRQYYNRTWESYEYKSVLKQLVNKAEKKLDISKKAIEEMRAFIKNPQRIEDDLKPLKALGALAKIGEFFGNTKKEKNDWKKRMLKAGLGNNLMLPDDWDSLPEEEKAKRLDGAIEQLRK